MTVVTATALREGTASLPLDDDTLIVVCLCAQWCDSCRQFRGVYERISAMRAEPSFVWLDIEDDAVLVGDLDIESFPTLALYRGERLLHYGASTPHPDVIVRLIDAARAGMAPVGAVPDSVRDLARVLQPRLTA
jgi:thioredoxin